MSTLPNSWPEGLGVRLTFDANTFTVAPAVLLTRQELAVMWKAHPQAIRKLFVAELTVTRTVHGPERSTRQHFTLRMLADVPALVLNRMKVRGVQ